MNRQFNRSDIRRNAFRLYGPLAHKGYDWWYHSFTGRSERTGRERSFFIEYFLCSPAVASAEPVLGQKKENKEAGRKPSYLMVKAGSWGEGGCQLHRFYAWKDIRVSHGVPYEIDAGECSAGEKHLTGKVCVTAEEVRAHPEYMCDSGSMTWDLAAEKQVAFNVGYGAGALFRFLNAFEMYWHAEGMKTQYSGTVTFNGETYRVDPETSYGYADKNWGSDFTSPWVWLSSCSLTSTVTGKKLTDSVFDVGGGKPRVFGIPLNRKLLSAFWYEGTPYEFNFSKFWTFTHTDFDCRETDDRILWHVYQKTLTAAVDIDISCSKKDMLLINYESPDGARRHNRLWNGGSGTGTVTLYRRHHGRLETIDTIQADHVGCEYGEYGV